VFLREDVQKVKLVKLALEKNLMVKKQITKYDFVNSIFLSIRDISIEILIYLKILIEEEKEILQMKMKCHCKLQ
jgi:hypothetical protein